jgi:hypothetical protein
MDRYLETVYYNGKLYMAWIVIGDHSFFVTNYSQVRFAELVLGPPTKKVTHPHGNGEVDNYYFYAMTRNENLMVDDLFTQMPFDAAIQKHHLETAWIAYQLFNLEYVPHLVLRWLHRQRRTSP